VSAVSASDAWAVGLAGCHTLTLHWDGTSWSRVTSPSGSGCYDPGSSNELDGVSADSGSDAWATGYNCTGAAQCPPLMLHWDGTSWTKVASPHPSSLTEPYGVSAVSGSDAWAVGAYDHVATHTWKTLILHWNGTSWTKE
jgi:hypothetical protein